jgi:hypothetical protein
MVLLFDIMLSHPTTGTPRPTVVMPETLEGTPVLSVTVKFVPSDAIEPSSVIAADAVPWAPSEPFTKALAAIGAADLTHVGQEIAGVTPPLETIGAVPETLDTPVIDAWGFCNSHCVPVLL